MNKNICKEIQHIPDKTPNIRETLSINYALKNVKQVGLNIIMQDDVFLIDEFIEDKILILKSKMD